MFFAPRPSGQWLSREGLGLWWWKDNCAEDSPGGIRTSERQAVVPGADQGFRTQLGGSRR